MHLNIIHDNAVTPAFDANSAVKSEKLTIADGNIVRPGNANAHRRCPAGGIGADHGKAVQVYGNVVDVRANVYAVEGVATGNIGRQIIGAGDGEIGAVVGDGIARFDLVEGLHCWRRGARWVQVPLGETG